MVVCSPDARHVCSPGGGDIQTTSYAARPQNPANPGIMAWLSDPTWQVFNGDFVDRVGSISPVLRTSHVIHMASCVPFCRG